MAPGQEVDAAGRSAPFPASWTSERFDPARVEQIYRTELASAEGSKSVPLQRVALLEIGQYLENYLWPHFDHQAASFEHVMSIVLMVNEKFRENVPAWNCFHGRKQVFSLFLHRVFTLQGERSLNLKEKTNYLLFLIHSFQSLEDPLVADSVLRLVSMELWHSLSPGRVKLELFHDETLLKPWLKLQKKAAASSANIQEKLEVRFLPSLMKDFLQVLDGAVVGSEIDASAVLFCERFVEFLIDLLSQMPTRRFGKAVVNDLAVVVKCKLSPLHEHPQGTLFRKLVDLLQFYADFELDDQKGLEVNVLKRHCNFIHSFQLLAFNQEPKLKEMALSNVGALNNRKELTKWLSKLSVQELKDLVCNKLMLIPASDTWADRVDFLKEVLVSAFEKRQSQRDFINGLPLYPTETVMWDESLVPSVNYTGEASLALHKLNLQFLTLNDYLLRNFHLFRLESTYEIRENIQEVLEKVAASVGDEGRTKFRGWARMATPVKSFKITQVKEPNIGDIKPSSVTAEVTFSIARCDPQLRAEWDDLKEHDVLFLLTVMPHLKPPSSEIAQHMTVPEKYGLKYVRGCEIVEIRDEVNHLMNDFTGRVKREEWKPPQGDQRTVVLALDCAQYQIDMDAKAEGEEDPYSSFNLLMRRKPKENNFKAILESIRDLTNEDCIVPDWLQDLVLGYFNPVKLQKHKQLHTVDFKDTFLDAQHLRESFPGEVKFVTPDGDVDESPAPPFRVTFPKSNTKTAIEEIADGNDTKVKRSRKRKASSGNGTADSETAVQEAIIVESYVPPDPGPYPQDQPKQNSVRFTPVQIEAIKSGVQPGLTMVVGPPGTGKTDTAVQILNVLYHNCPSQRTLLITHSNQALNDLFEKIMQRDVPARYLLRLGQGEQELETELDFSRQGRVNAMLTRRLELLAEVERLARTLSVPDDVAYTCETAAHFWLLHVLARWEEFVAACEATEDNPGIVMEKFPFMDFFSDTPHLLFSGLSYAEDMRAATGCFKHLKTMFQELEECRAFELLKTTADRANYLMTKQAKIVAMTCTHAALKRRDFLRIGFKYDNLLMEESAQILEIETFIPMLLQRQEDGRARLKRCILIGDHHQLPPVVKNMAYQKFSHLDQSLFARFVRLGVPHVELNAQGRARPSIAKLYNWRYKDLGDLPDVQQEQSFLLGNAGFAYDYQLIDVPDYLGRGEKEPSHWFYQNLGEAEYVVSVYQYMRLLGYPANKISILTTYNGQKHLIRDVIESRCAKHPLFGRPSKVTTADRFQGQQNDYVLLSLVRTRVVGHLRDVRRLVVAMSRARLGLYVFCRRSLFEQCYELRPTFQKLLQRPDKLALVLDESVHPTSRRVEETGNAYLVQNGVHEMAEIVNSKFMQMYGAGTVSKQLEAPTNNPVQGEIEEDGNPINQMVVDENPRETVVDQSGVDENPRDPMEM
ncbi:RNA helicase aquarius [Selaginella moellendorffii]|uniref:RNA helicase aquarius n=1 Tax=Selaginella moellendorffii TaxID=88036 RepID=UPI000D1CF06D|nr:RNA helicase aquarius [Selaginella moellendorffii]|eukprot:XP_024517313.1 RNA helicase aquarius [Selaginella moellendorffii]